MDSMIDELLDETSEANEQALTNWFLCFPGSYGAKRLTAKIEIKNSLLETELEAHPERNFLIKLISGKPNGYRTRDGSYEKRFQLFWTFIAVMSRIRNECWREFMAITLRASVPLRRSDTVDDMAASNQVHERASTEHCNFVLSRYPRREWLHMAAKFEQVETVKKLLEDGEVLEHNEHGCTPLHYAAMAIQPNANIARMLVECIAEYTDEDNFKCAINYQTDDVWGQNTALHIAAANVNVTQEFIDMLVFADPGIPNSKNDTPFHVAAKSSNPDAIVYLLNTFAPTNAGWDIDDVDDDVKTKFSLINMCARSGNASAVGLLIKHGADISKGVLHEIVLESVRRPDKVEKLIEVYRVIMENVVAWRCLEEHTEVPQFKGYDDYTKIFCQTAIWLLTTPLVGDDYQTTDVLQCAIAHGAEHMFWHIINTKSVFRVEKDDNKEIYDVSNFTQETLLKRKNGRRSSSTKPHQKHYSVPVSEPMSPAGTLDYTTDVRSDTVTYITPRSITLTSRRRAFDDDIENDVDDDDDDPIRADADVVVCEIAENCSASPHELDEDRPIFSSDEHHELSPTTATESDPRSDDETTAATPTGLPQNESPPSPEDYSRTSRERAFDQYFSVGPRLTTVPELDSLLYETTETMPGDDVPFTIPGRTETDTSYKRAFESDDRERPRTPISSHETPATPIPKLNNSRISRISHGRTKRNFKEFCSPTIPYLTYLLLHFDQWKNTDILSKQPFKSLTMPYITFVQRFYLFFGILQLIYMIVFSWHYIPDACSLSTMFNISSSPCNKSRHATLEVHDNATLMTRTAKQARSYPTFLWVIWPAVLMLYNLLTFYFAIEYERLRANLRLNKKVVTVQDTCTSVPLQFCKILFQSLPLKIFCFIVPVWFYSYRYSDSDTPTFYIETTALVLLFGWIANLHFFGTVNKNFNISALVVKEIVMKDLSSFMVFFGFTVVGFSFAMHALRFSTCANQVFYADETFYLVLSSAFGIGDFFEKKITHPSCKGEGTRHLFEAVYFGYVCTTMIILLNVLIAMMNQRYEIAKSRVENMWRFRILSLAVALENHNLVSQMIKRKLFNLFRHEGSWVRSVACKFGCYFHDKNRSRLAFNHNRYYLDLVVPVYEKYFQRYLGVN